MIILLVSWSYRSNSPCFCNCFGNFNNQQCAVLCWEGGGIPLVLLWFQLWWGRLERPLSSENSFFLTQNHFIICVSLQNCNGFRQSPIDVDFATTTASGTHSNGALTFGGYDQVIIITIIILYLYHYYHYLYHYYHYFPLTLIALARSGWAYFPTLSSTTTEEHQESRVSLTMSWQTMDTLL